MAPGRLAALTALTLLAFAANSILNRQALAGGAAGPLAFAALRLVSGAVVLGILARLRSGGLRVALPPLRAAMLALYVLGFSLAYRGLDAGVGALILFGCVQITMMSGAWVRGERPGPAGLLGAMLALAGLVWLCWPRAAVALPLASVVPMALAGIGWGAFSLLGRQGGEPLLVMAGAFRLAMLPVLVLAALFWDGITPSGAVLAVLSGGVTSGLGYALWYRVLPLLGPMRGAVAQLSVPPIAMALGALFLAERPGPAAIAAAAVVIGGVALALASRRR